jgi:hypothetical protein
MEPEVTPYLGFPYTEVPNRIKVYYRTYILEGRALPSNSFKKNILYKLRLYGLLEPSMRRKMRLMSKEEKKEYHRAKHRQTMQKKRALLKEPLRVELPLQL